MITCDGCGTRKMWTAVGVSVSRATSWARDDGWSSKRSAKIEYQSTGWDAEKGAVVPVTKTYTVPLHFCPSCKAAGKSKTIKTAII